jgi:hypothetical protein
MNVHAITQPSGMTLTGTTSKYRLHIHPAGDAQELEKLNDFEPLLDAVSNDTILQDRVSYYSFLPCHWCDLR